ncbi:Ku protein [Frankia sp. CNm7]|uniref:Non-homologous end joining protein Ku n=1 Tax=Frankia nepalensis TaxID=1836974 RepID=A0A937RRM1_9ACTN|nr:Ku protein [Frankia nepalensis]MBL7500826.1 Ku protein [Frankia nepalensis]MBL7515382.1 Ku protein [Frankia nepalensis]MBL7518310.1 Ku protein [Frankia nepalensis]MBL7631448.1 Ku protein [Frankia nepalensis]
MRSIWKGAISFGLVSVPVKLYSATEERDVAFHQVRRSDGSRIRYKRVAAADGEEVPYSEIAKGYELPDGETVVLTDEDFANLPLSTSRAIDVLGFVPLEQVDPIYFAKSYYLEPDKHGSKPYVLLRDALESSGRVALVKIALRQREQLATLRVRGGVFVLETMLWPDEVRVPDFPFLEDEIQVREQELDMARSLIDTLADDFDPTRFGDQYREALLQVIDAKIAGQEVVAPPVEEKVGPAGDLMAALRASIEAVRSGRPAGGAAGPEAEAEPERAAEAAEAAGPATVGGKAKATGRKTAAKSAGPKNAPPKTAPRTAAAGSKSTAAKSTAAKSPTRRSA